MKSIRMGAAVAALSIVAFETRTFDPNGPCPWFKVPPEPQPDGSTKRRATGTFARVDVPRRVRGRFNRRADFSSVSCADWNAANDVDREWMIDRIKGFVGGSVNDHEKVVGYGDTLAFHQADALFNSWCRRSYGQSFLLYKLYAYAAVFSE